MTASFSDLWIYGETNRRFSVRIWAKKTASFFTQLDGEATPTSPSSLGIEARRLIHPVGRISQSSLLRPDLGEEATKLLHQVGRRSQL